MTEITKEILPLELLLGKPKIVYSIMVGKKNILKQY